MDSCFAQRLFPVPPLLFPARQQQPGRVTVKSDLLCQRDEADAITLESWALSWPLVVPTRSLITDKFVQFPSFKPDPCCISSTSLLDRLDPGQISNLELPCLAHGRSKSRPCVACGLTGETTNHSIGSVPTAPHGDGVTRANRDRTYVIIHGHNRNCRVAQRCGQTTTRRGEDKTKRRLPAQELRALQSPAPPSFFLTLPPHVGSGTAWLPKLLPTLESPPARIFAESHSLDHLLSLFTWVLDKRESNQSP